MSKYHYAKNCAGEIVSIQDAEAGAVYFCIGCGHEVLAKKGQIREHHFCHRQVVDCNGETYTHQCAKQFIKNLFDRQEHLYVSFKRTEQCCLKENCAYQIYDLGINNGECSLPKDVTFDLKKYYDTCELEAECNGFVADILLRNSQRPKIKPCLVEIAVTHFCEEEKIKSGLPIIEISVPAGTENFDQLKTISETPELVFGRKPQKGIEVVFHNFKTTGRSNEPHDIYDVYAFFINGSGKGQVKERQNSCSSYGTKHLIHESAHEIHFSRDYLAYKAGVAIANLGNRVLPNCWVCQHHWYSIMNGEHGCKKGLYYIHSSLFNPFQSGPSRPSPSQASSCPAYSFARWQAQKLEKEARDAGYRCVAPSGNKV